MNTEFLAIVAMACGWDLEDALSAVSEFIDEQDLSEEFCKFMLLRVAEHESKLMLLPLKELIPAIGELENIVKFPSYREVQYSSLKPEFREGNLYIKCGDFYIRCFLLPQNL